MHVAVLKESAARERRVALTPDSVARLVKSKVDVVIQHEAGDQAGFPDAAYTSVGARIAPDMRSACSDARVMLKVQPPTADEIACLAQGSVLISLLRPGRHAEIAQQLAQRGVSPLA